MCSPGAHWDLGLGQTSSKFCPPAYSLLGATPTAAETEPHSGTLGQRMVENIYSILSTGPPSVRDYLWWQFTHYIWRYFGRFYCKPRAKTFLPIDFPDNKALLCDNPSDICNWSSFSWGSPLPHRKSSAVPQETRFPVPITVISSERLWVVTYLLKSNPKTDPNTPSVIS